MGVAGPFLEIWGQNRLRLEVSPASGDLFLASCWSLVSDQQGNKNYGKSANNYEFFHGVIRGQSKQRVRILQRRVRQLQLQKASRDRLTLRFSLRVVMLF